MAKKLLFIILFFFPVFVQSAVKINDVTRTGSFNKIDKLSIREKNDLMFWINDHCNENYQTWDDVLNDCSLDCYVTRDEIDERLYSLHGFINIHLINNLWFNIIALSILLILGYAIYFNFRNQLEKIEKLSYSLAIASVFTYTVINIYSNAAPLLVLAIVLCLIILIVSLIHRVSAIKFTSLVAWVFIGMFIPLNSQSLVKEKTIIESIHSGDLGQVMKHKNINTSEQYKISYFTSVTPLEYALNHKCYKISNFLLEHAPEYSGARSGSTELSIAAKAHNLDFLKKVTNGKTYTEKEIYFAVKEAIIYNDMSALKYILAAYKPKDYTYKNNEYESLLGAAVENPKAFQLLMDYFISDQNLSCETESPHQDFASQCSEIMRKAIIFKDMNIMHFLISKGYDINRCNNITNSIAYENYDALAFFITNGDYSECIADKWYAVRNATELKRIDDVATKKKFMELMGESHYQSNNTDL